MRIAVVVLALCVVATATTATAAAAGPGGGLVTATTLAAKRPAKQAPAKQAPAKKAPAKKKDPPGTQEATATPPRSDDAPPVVVIVGKGDTLSSIARAHGVSVAALVQANRLARPDALALGQRLVIPGRRAPPASPPVTPPASAAAPARIDAEGDGPGVVDAPVRPDVDALLDRFAAELADAPSTPATATSPTTTPPTTTTPTTTTPTTTAPTTTPPTTTTPATTTPTATPPMMATRESAGEDGSTTTDETVRIAVGRFPSTVTVTGSPFRIRRGADATDDSQTTARFQVGRKGLVVDGRPWPSDIAFVEAVDASGTLRLGKHRYRRRLEVRYAVYDGRAELLVVHPLDLETYVAGIVSAELPTGWPLAAYQAQAVAARTFAVAAKYRRLDLPYHMEASVIDQVYGGVDREHDLARVAAASTRGVVLTWQRRLANAYFHASCGGRTESAADGWGSTMEYLPGSRCTDCTTAARAKWKTRVSRKDVDRAFARVLGASVQKMTIVEKTASGRARRIKLEHGKRSRIISGSDLRRLLGWSVVWSTQIDRLEFGTGGLVVEGRGSGHGVGLCQWGARGAAEAGLTWIEILARYYPGATMSRLY